MYLEYFFNVKWKYNVVEWLGFEPTLRCWQHQSLGPMNKTTQMNYTTQPRHGTNTVREKYGLALLNIFTDHNNCNSLYLDCMHTKIIQTGVVCEVGAILLCNNQDLANSLSWANCSNTHYKSYKCKSFTLKENYRIGKKKTCPRSQIHIQLTQIMILENIPWIISVWNFMFDGKYIKLIWRLYM